MPVSTVRFACCLALWACSIVPNGFGQEAGTGGRATDTEAVQQEKDIQRRLGELAADFRFETVGKESVPLTRSAMPLLTFTNPVRGRGQLGSIYLWTQGNRPGVVGSLWTFRGQNDSHRLSIELHSLCSSTLATKLPAIANPRRPLPVWNPPAESISWTMLPGAEPPGVASVATTGPRIKSLVRRIADRFTADVIDPATGKGQPLRLLSKPLYEYESEGVSFGAMFAFVMATDPELMLCLEARPAPAGTQLHYALARMTGRELRASVDGEAIWKVDRASVWDGMLAYYFCPNVTGL